MSLSKFKALLLVSFVFLLGAIAGASLGTAIVSKKFAAPMDDHHRPSREKMIEKFKTRLHLSDAQTGKLQPILDEAHKQFGELHQSVKPQFEAIRKGMQDKIREQLDETQKKEFEAMVREFEQRWAREEPK